MRRTRVAAAVVAAALLALTMMLAGCGGGDGVGADVVTVNASEPQNPLIPTNTNETQGGRIIDRLFAGLMSYDANGALAPEVARLVETTDNVNYRIVLRPGWTFSDGSPVTARSFVDAWNYGALAGNAQLQQSFFSPIEGYDEVAGVDGAGEPTATTMSGLRIVDDHEFTVRLASPTIDFAQRLAFSPFYPLPASAFDDMAAFGQHPVGNGPYRLTEPGSWQHHVKIDLVANPGYHGNRVAQNNRLRFVFYAGLDTAYADLLSGNLDVLDTLPPSALPTYRADLGDRAVTGPAAVNQTLKTPLRLPHFGGEEGRLRRLALSAAINRPQICRQIFSGARTPAREFTAESLPGFDPDIPGNEALAFDPERARRLWTAADALSAWSGRYVIAYNADGGHQEWVDAVANSIKNVLGIDAVGAAQPTFAGFRTQITNRSIATAFRAGWQGDYPSILEFLEPGLTTGSSANDVGYSNRAFDSALARAEAAASLPEAYALTNAAQRILLHDMPVVPLWYYISVAARSPSISSLAITWNGLPDYEHIVKE
jgi:oligopeptide transport system substrate-binding protein